MPCSVFAAAMFLVPLRSWPTPRRYVLRRLASLLPAVWVACGSLLWTLPACGEEPVSEVAGRSLADWTADLASSNAVVRRRAALTLPAFGSLAVPALSEGLQHTDTAVVYWSASGLGDLGEVPADTLPVLRELLAHERMGVRMSAAYALCRGGKVDEGLPVLMEVLEHGPQTGLGSGPRTAAADFIGRVGPPAEAALPLLERTSQETDYHVRDSSKEAIRRIHGEGPV